MATNDSAGAVMMEQELQALKDELARVRAREKRFKDSAEAQITHLQEELALIQKKMNDAAARITELEAQLEAKMSRCRNLEEKTALLQQEKAALREELAAAKEVEEQAHKDQAELAWAMRRQQGLDQENIRLRNQIEELQRSQIALESELEQLKVQSVEQEKMARCYGELLQAYPQLATFMKKAQHHSLVQHLNRLFSAGKR